jgi:ubiquinone/menaquinone biosynthesis C-methylase UbiE
MKQKSALLLKQLIPESWRDLFYGFRENSYSRSWNRLSRENAVKAVFGRDATESEFDEAGARDAEWIRDIIGNDQKVLDVGCGLGRLEKYLSPFCSTINAVDVSPQMLKLASTRLGKLSNVSFSLVKDDCKLSQFQDGAFDVVISLFVLEHLDKEDAFRYLIEFNRVLRPDGKCILQFPNFCRDIYFDSFIENVKSHTTRRKKARVRFYTTEEVSFMLSKAGFSCMTMQNDDNDCEIRVAANKVDDAFRMYPFIKRIK